MQTPSLPRPSSGLPRLTADGLSLMTSGGVRDRRPRAAGSVRVQFGGSVAGPSAQSQDAFQREPRDVPTGDEVATLAGGCFWGVEELIRAVPGVRETVVGYTGGTTPNASYEDVKTGGTGHAEAVKVVFDPAQVSYERILLEFFRLHDPTTYHRQGNDVGSQYRSAIFYHSEAQKRAAERVRARVDASGAWTQPVVTEIVMAGPFYQAEDYHQDYLQKHPHGYTCHYVRPLAF
jgi:peptide-methionine (S)-S-oxide reductase